MKRFISLILTIALSAAMLCACGAKDENTVYVYTGANTLTPKSLPCLKKKQESRLFTMNLKPTK